MQSRINTNLKSVEEDGSARANYNSAGVKGSRSIDVSSTENDNQYFNPYDQAGIQQRNELQEIHDEREERLAKKKKLQMSE